MLSYLKIQNYALIDNLEIDFSKGLSIITGETGAGKSIIVGALSLILGQRADAQVLPDKKKKCIVEGIFNIQNYGLENFFETNELDYEDNTLLRREINQNGKSRAFINDTPVKLNVLKEIGEKLVDIHSQLTTLTLNEQDFQLAVVDNYAKIDTSIKTQDTRLNIQDTSIKTQDTRLNIQDTSIKTQDTRHKSKSGGLLKEYKTEYYNYINLKNKLNVLIEQENKAKADKDYFQFQFNELDKAELKEGEQAELENELEILNNSELIKKSLFDASYTLNSSDNNLLLKLNEILQSVRKVSEFHISINEISKRLESSRIELSDISKELEHVESQIHYDPEILEKINERLDVLYSLEKKHNVSSVEELLKVRETVSDKLLSISTLDENISKLKKEIDTVHSTLITQSNKLTSERKKHIPLIEKEITKILRELGMPDAQFKINTTELSQLNVTGKDKVVYFFNANRGGELKEIAKAASGGELSRLMLSIKSIISQRNLLPTIILDEIDVGVSGDIAGKVGTIIQKMSIQMQVIAITHQPQIASKGDIHYLVYKETSTNSTRTAIRKLNEEERAEEIAKMISGTKISKSATQTAKEMMK